jgi:hypothetical protein
MNYAFLATAGQHSDLMAAKCNKIDATSRFYRLLGNQTSIDFANALPVLGVLAFCFIIFIDCKAKQRLEARQGTF